MLSSMSVRDVTGKPFVSTRSELDDRVVAQAISLLEHRLFSEGPALSDPMAASDYMRLLLLPEPAEVFAVLFLNAHNHAIACEILFRGTVNSTVVYPRVIAQRALFHNAAALIVAHQHPSGVREPSRDDRHLTDRLKLAMELFDIRLLDHFVIGKGRPYSFAENGLL